MAEDLAWPGRTGSGCLAFAADRRHLFQGLLDPGLGNTGAEAGLSLIELPALLVALRAQLFRRGESNPVGWVGPAGGAPGQSFCRACPASAAAAPLVEGPLPPWASRPGAMANSGMLWGRRGPWRGHRALPLWPAHSDPVAINRLQTLNRQLSFCWEARRWPTVLDPAPGAFGRPWSASSGA